MQIYSWVWPNVKVYLLLHTYLSENFSSCECKVNLLMCIFAHWVVVMTLVAAFAFHSMFNSMLELVCRLVMKTVCFQNVYCAKMSTANMSAVPKCLLCQNVYSQNVYCAKMSTVKNCQLASLFNKYQENIDVSWKIPLAIKFMWTQYNFTRGSFYIREYIYIYVKIHIRVSFVHVNCTLDSFLLSGGWEFSFGIRLDRVKRIWYLSPMRAVSQEKPSDRKPDPWPLWMAGHAQLKFVMTECSKTQIRLTGLRLWYSY